jgi:hypothetical protein
MNAQGKSWRAERGAD